MTDKLTRQGVRNLDLIGPRPPKRVAPNHGHTWTPWQDISSTSDDVAGYIRERRECTSCGEEESRTLDPYGGGVA